MPQELGRSVLQIVLVALLLLGALGSLGCFGLTEQANCTAIIMTLACRSGSSESSSSTVNVTHHAAWLDQGAGLVENWHDFNLADVTLTSKDLRYLKGWVPDHSLVIGLRVPRAPGAAAPGVLAPVTPQLDLWYDGWQHHVVVNLASDEAHAARIAALLPPGPHARWQALTPVDIPG